MKTETPQDADTLRSMHFQRKPPDPSSALARSCSQNARMYSKGCTHVAWLSPSILRLQHDRSWRRSRRRCEVRLASHQRDSRSQRGWARSLVVAQVRAVELEIQQLLVRLFETPRNPPTARVTRSPPTSNTRAAQHVRERRLNVTRRHPWTYIRAISSSSFSVRLNVGVENL